MSETPRKQRLLMALVAVLAGIFMVVVAPLLVQTSLERVLTALQEVVQERPAFSSGIALFSLFYPIWRAFGFVAGITLLLMAPAIHRGEEWTWPVALAALAIPAVGGMFMFLPYISWVGGFPLPMVISWVGLAGFWGIIFLRKARPLQKWAWFLALTFIGMLATHAFTIGIGAQRMLITRPGKPLFAGVSWWILTWTGEVNWIGTIMLLVAIPLLAAGRRSGWWLALIAAVSILAIDAPTQLIRLKTYDYLYGSLLAVGVLFFINIPAFKQALLASERNGSGDEEASGVAEVGVAT